MDPTTPSQLLHHAIRQNWSIPPSDPHLIPPSLLAGLPPLHLAPPLLGALHRLSSLTLGQRDRAYNLLNTYFQARMREGGSSSAAGVLEVGDVAKACGSARKMSYVGLTVEAGDGSRSGRRSAGPVYYMSDGGEESAAVWGQGEGGGEWVQEVEAAQAQVQARVEVALVRKPRVELAPIVTTQSFAPAVAMGVAEGEGEGDVLSSFTPLFRRLRDELGSGCVSAGGGFGLDGQRQQQQQQQQGLDVSQGEKGEGSEAWATETDVSAAQHAMHEFNVRRLKMEGKKREYEDAMWRFEEARRRMESVKGG